MSLKVKQLKDDALVVELKGRFGEYAIQEVHEFEIPIRNHKRVK